MPVVDLLAGEGRGPVWGDVTEDLNLTVLAWADGEGAAEHVNDVCDIVVVVVAGAGTVLLDGVEHGVRAGSAVVIPRGARRALTAGPGGIRYLSVHRRRSGLQITRPARP